jgi:hypothetical protein
MKIAIASLVVSLIGATTASANSLSPIDKVRVRCSTEVTKYLDSRAISHTPTAEMSFRECQKIHESLAEELNSNHTRLFKVVTTVEIKGRTPVVIKSTPSSSRFVEDDLIHAISLLECFQQYIDLQEPTAAARDTSLSDRPKGLLRRYSGIECYTGSTITKIEGSVRM